MYMNWDNNGKEVQFTSMLEVYLTKNYFYIKSRRVKYLTEEFQTLISGNLTVEMLYYLFKWK